MRGKFPENKIDCMVVMGGVPRKYHWIPHRRNLVRPCKSKLDKYIPSREEAGRMQHNLPPP